MYKQLNLKHQQSGVNSNFTGDSLAFSDYIANTRNMIATAHREFLNGKVKTKKRISIVDANSPFEWRPSEQYKSASGKYKKGILLIHGLLSSPFATRDIGNYFYKKGYLVRSILLPGHGTVPGDLLEVEREAWYAAAEYGYRKITEQAEDISVMGISIGGTLAATLAYKHNSIEALYLITPSIKLRSKYVFIANLFRQLSKLHTPSAWYSLADDHDYAKYESFPYNLAYQANGVTKDFAKLREKRRLEIPIFMALAGHDETVNSLAAEKFFLEQPNAKSKLIIYDNTSKLFNDPRVEYRSSFYPHENILNFSHVCIQNSPDNEHYGRNGDYVPKLSIPDQKHPNGHKVIYKGSLASEDVTKYHLHRLTYNPDFHNMLLRLDDFLLETT